MPVKYSPIRKDKVIELIAAANEVKDWPLEDKIWHMTYGRERIDNAASVKEYCMAVWKGRKDKMDEKTGEPKKEAIIDMHCIFSKLRKSYANFSMVLRPVTNTENQIVYVVVILKGKYADTEKATKDRVESLKTTEKKEKEILELSPKKLRKALEENLQKLKLKHSRRSRKRGGGAGIN